MPLNSPAEHIPGFEYRATVVEVVARSAGQVNGLVGADLRLNLNGSLCP
jgi:hypothetical protein